MSKFTKTGTKILNINVEKLDDEHLTSVSSGMLDVGGFFGEMILHALFCGGLVVAGGIGAVACTVASGYSFYHGNSKSGVVLATAAVGSAGAVATGIALYKKGF